MANRDVHVKIESQEYRTKDGFGVTVTTEFDSLEKATEWINAVRAARTESDNMYRHFTE